MTIKDWDEIDEWAAQFGRWSDLSRELDLPKKKGPYHIPSCYDCFGTGHGINNLIDQELMVCGKCGGTGLRRTQPKYLDVEIREIVQKIGIDRVKELVAQYGQRNRKRQGAL